MDRKNFKTSISALQFLLFVGTVFTGCNDGEDASEPYLLKRRKTSRVSCQRRRVALRLLLINCWKVRVESESDEGISYLLGCWTAVKLPGQRFGVYV